jgi:catechol 2,3-dioxygenase-like lactoylglutathione lyase family enzyme
MEHIDKLVQDFEQGKINRRQLIMMLALTSAGAAVGPAGAAESSPIKIAGIHHISYQVADYARSRDFYAALLGAPVSDDDGKQQCVLTVGGIRFILRNGMPGRTPFVDHIAYGVENWNQDGVLADLKRRGLNPEPEGENSFQFKDPDGYHVQLNPRK